MIEAMLMGGGVVKPYVQRIFVDGYTSGPSHDFDISEVDPGKTIAYITTASPGSTSYALAHRVEVFSTFIRVTNAVSNILPLSIEIVEFSGSVSVTHTGATVPAPSESQSDVSLDVTVEQFDPGSTMIFLSWSSDSSGSNDDDISMIYDVVDSTTIRLTRKSASLNQLYANIQIARF